MLCQHGQQREALCSYHEFQARELLQVQTPRVLEDKVWRGQGIRNGPS